MVTTADGHAEHKAAKEIVGDTRQAKDDPEIEIALGADKGYDAKEFIAALQEINVTPYAAQNTTDRRHIACSPRTYCCRLKKYWS